MIENALQISVLVKFHIDSKHTEGSKYGMSETLYKRRIARDGVAQFGVDVSFGWCPPTFRLFHPVCLLLTDPCLLSVVGVFSYHSLEVVSVSFARTQCFEATLTFLRKP